MNEDDDPFDIQAVAISGLVNSALTAALIGKLAEKGLLSDADTRDIYDDALHSLELQQAAADAQTADLYRRARQVIEEPLRDIKPPRAEG